MLEAFLGCGFAFRNRQWPGSVPNFSFLMPKAGGKPKIAFMPRMTQMLAHQLAADKTR
jgi:hypothetical protein